MPDRIKLSKLTDDITVLLVDLNLFFLIIFILEFPSTIYESPVIQMFHILFS